MACYCRVLAADLSLLSRIPHGRLLSRVSKDTEAVDDQLPFITNIVLASAAGFVAALLLMLTSQPLLLILLALLAAFYFQVQRLYRSFPTPPNSRAVAPIHPESQPESAGKCPTHGVNYFGQTSNTQRDLSMLWCCCTVLISW